MTVPRPLLIDCDPGTDDALALFLALASPDTLELRHVTTVHGNKPLPQTTTNALRILAAAGCSDIPVHPGIPHPLLDGQPVDNQHHGSDGLGDAGLPDTASRPSSKHAVDALIDPVMDAPPGTITLCAIGPLTNVAAALRQEPRLTERLGEILVMGGDIRPDAPPEFNFKTDPLAANVVLSSGAPITLFGLNATTQAQIGQALAKALRRTGSRTATMAAALLDTSPTSSGYVHDACTIAYLLDPTLCTTAIGTVDVEWQMPYRAGATTFTPDEKGLVRVVTGVDSANLLTLLVQRLADLP